MNIQVTLWIHIKGTARVVCTRHVLVKMPKRDSGTKNKKEEQQKSVSELLIDRHHGRILY